MWYCIGCCWKDINFSNKYVKNAVNAAQDLFDLDGNGLKINGATTPFHSGYKPELEVTEEVDHGGSKYWQLIGIQECAVELGQIDILLEVPLLLESLTALLYWLCGSSVLCVCIFKEPPYNEVGVWWFRATRFKWQWSFKQKVVWLVRWCCRGTTAQYALWFSKRPNTVETSTFGSKMVAMRIAKEMIVALRYKLWMFGVPINGPARVFLW